MQVQDFNIPVTLQSMRLNDFGKYLIKRPSVQACHYLHMILIKIQVPRLYIFLNESSVPHQLQLQYSDIKLAVMPSCF